LKAGVVDIGTNSMRLLITDGEREQHRWVEVTGLGRGVDVTGVLADDAMARSIRVFETFGRLMDDAGVGRRAAFATSASRDASNRVSFFDEAEMALGIRPELIDGDREGRLAYAGAISGMRGLTRPMVSDIGGGSTEFVTENEVISIDIGTVRLGDRVRIDRPATTSQVLAAQQMVNEMFVGAIEAKPLEIVGVAGTWTTLAAVVHPDDSEKGTDQGLVIRQDDAHNVLELLAAMTLEETAEVPGLDPARAEVILPGAIIALSVMKAFDAGVVFISERDTLDAMAAELLAIP
jgi:exopolyphosphatase/guanosine-5'-triphosphate,3'-diphosphate pyrophosphatase